MKNKDYPPYDPDMFIGNYKVLDKFCEMYKEYPKTSIYYYISEIPELIQLHVERTVSDWFNTGIDMYKTIACRKLFYCANIKEFVYKIITKQVYTDDLPVNLVALIFVSIGETLEEFACYYK